MIRSTVANEPRVYVLIVNWHGWQDTIECLESLLRQAYGSFRIVVCNNDPADDSLEKIQEWAAGRMISGAAPEHPLAELWDPPVTKPIEVVRYTRAEAETRGAGDDGGARLVLIETGDNLGFAGGNNVGLRYVQRQPDAAYVWLLNNDTVVAPDALSSLVKLAEARPDAGIIGSKLLHYDRSDILQTAAGGTVVSWRGLTTHLGEDEPDEGQWDEVIEVDYVTGASMLVRRSLLESVGELDERYFLYSEEVDWCLRSRAIGWTLLYAPGSRVWHKGGQSVQYRSPLHDYYTVRSMLLLVRKFHPMLLPFTFLYSLYRCLAPKVVRRQGRRFGAVILAYRDFLRMVISPAAMARPPRPSFGRAPSAPR